LHEDETKRVSEMTDENATLELEHLSVDTAAMKTKNAGEMESLRFVGGFCLCHFLI
jgi:hypothetical protein